MATVDELRQQLANLQNSYQASQSMGGRRNDNRGYADFMNQQFALNAQIEAASRAQAQQAMNATSGGGGGGDRVDQAQADVTRLTEDRAREVQEDPYTTSALSYLQNVMNGQETPFNAATQSAMRSRASDNSAAAMTAQSQALIENATRNGGSAQDPAVQAALRELNSRRQMANMGASQDINAQANVQNFNARMGGANSLAAIRGAQNAQVNQLGLAGADYKSRTFEDQPTGGGAMFSQSVPAAVQRLGGSAPRTPTPAPAPIPRPAPRPVQSGNGGLVVAPNQPGRKYMVGVGTGAPPKPGMVNQAINGLGSAKKIVNQIPDAYARLKQIYNDNTAITPDGRKQVSSPSLRTVQSAIRK